MRIYNGPKILQIGAQRQEFDGLDSGYWKVPNIGVESLVINCCIIKYILIYLHDISFNRNV